MSIRKLTEQYFNEVKQALKWYKGKSVNRIAYKQGISVKTVLQVKGSRNYQEYQDQNKAQHPPLEFSLRENVLKVHRLIFDKEDYAKPTSARMAIGQIEYAVRENKWKI